MVHKFLLSIDTSQGHRYDQLTTYLFDNKLVKSVVQGNMSQDGSEGTVYVFVPNRRKFEAYLNKRNSNRAPGDPREMIRSSHYEGKTYIKPPDREETATRQALKRLKKQTGASGDGIKF